MPRKSEQEWAIIENEYATMPVTLADLSKKYGLSINALSVRSIKDRWEMKRNRFKENACKKIQDDKAKNKSSEDYRLLDDIREIIKLKSTAEKLMIQKILDAGVISPKDLGYVLNKSKDSITELAKLEQLLIGNASERVDFTGDAKEAGARKSRMELLGFNN